MEIHSLEAMRDLWYFKLNQIVDKNVTENIFLMKNMWIYTKNQEKGWKWGQI